MVAKGCDAISRQCLCADRTPTDTPERCRRPATVISPRSSQHGLRRRCGRCWLRRGRVLRRLWLSGVFRTLRALLRNWLRLWVVLRRQQLSILQLCWLRLSLLWLCWLQLSFLWLRLPPWLSRRPQGGHSSSPLALKSLAPRGAARWLVAHYIRSDPGNPSSSSSHR